MAITLSLIGGTVIGAGLERVTTAKRNATRDDPMTQSEQQVTRAEADALRAELGRALTPEDLAVAKTEIRRLKKDNQDLQELSSVIRQELAALASQVALVNARQGSEHYLALADEPERETWEEGAGKQDLTPEEAQSIADEHSRSQVELIEQTMQREETDPQWAEGAQQSLRDAFQDVELTGLHFEDAVCQTTLCRLNLTVDVDTDPGEGFREMRDAIPWEGTGFSRIDAETGEIEVYLARKGHALPRLPR